MRVLLVAFVVFFAGCQSPKNKHDFVFFKWNIHESYYLKFNSSDTLYYINTYPFEEQNYFTILSIEEKETLQNILDSISFPKQKEFLNREIEDGESYAFYLKPNILKIHGEKGPNQFWIFGKLLEEIKKQHKFSKTNKKIDLSEINKILFVPIPSPIINI